MADRWTLADRTAEPLLDACLDLGVSAVAAAPFNSGLLNSPWPPDNAHFENELNEYWGLFDMLQAAGLNHLSRSVALRAVEAQDEDLRRAGRDWLLELEDGIERR